MYLELQPRKRRKMTAMIPTFDQVYVLRVLEQVIPRIYAYMIGWIYSEPAAARGVTRGGKKNMRPARPGNAAKRSGFVNYGIERGQSLNNEVI